VAIVPNVMLAGATDRQIEEMLRAAGMHVAPIEMSSLQALASPGIRQPDVLMLDLRNGVGVPPAVAMIRRNHPATGVVLVATRLDPALLLEAMRAGVNEVVSNPVTQATLEQAIARVAAVHRPTSEAGQVFGFVGAKGGVGTTTLAVNVATSLGSINKQGRTALVDLHSGGDAAVFTGVEPRFSILDAFENTHRLDQNFLRGLVVQIAPNVDLLAAPERGVAGRADPGRLSSVIEALSSSFRYTVLDLPRSDSAVLDVLDPLSHIVVVGNQELATIKGASRLATALRRRYGGEKVWVVLTRSDRQSEIGHDDVERAIGSPVVHVFPSDYRLALQALNKGRPLALENHNDLSSSFKRFAFQLAGIAPDRTTAPRGGLLGRLTQGRR
jgi:pilus assembly protein CpaE